MTLPVRGVGSNQYQTKPPAQGDKPRCVAASSAAGAWEAALAMGAEPAFSRLDGNVYLFMGCKVWVVGEQLNNMVQGQDILDAIRAMEREHGPTMRLVEFQAPITDDWEDGTYGYCLLPPQLNFVPAAVVQSAIRQFLGSEATD